jgi:KipI family sensor histidine kinase inhibitor
VPSWVPLGDRAIRFARPAGVSPRTIVKEVRAWPGVVDVVVARDDVAAYFAAEPVVADVAIRALAKIKDDLDTVRDIELAATYDGPDLDDVAQALGLTTGEVKQLHAAGVYTVETMGFAPGFAYLTGLDPKLVLPRRATPRPRVPAGSLAIAGSHTAVYPFDSPGGWHLIGRVPARMFGPDGPLLRLADRVRFVPS